MRGVVTERTPLSECAEHGSQVDVGHGTGQLPEGACPPGCESLPFTSGGWGRGGRGRLQSLEDTGHSLEAGESQHGDSVGGQQRERGRGWMVQILVNQDI